MKIIKKYDGELDNDIITGISLETFAKKLKCEIQEDYVGNSKIHYDLYGFDGKEVYEEWTDKYYEVNYIKYNDIIITTAPWYDDNAL